MSSTTTVPLISMTPASPARYISGFLVDLAQEHESKGKVDEVHGFDEADDGEQPRDHPALRFGLSRYTADERVAGKPVTEGSTDGTEAHEQTEANQGTRELDSVISHVTPPE